MGMGVTGEGKGVSARDLRRVSSSKGEGRYLGHVYLMEMCFLMMPKSLKYWGEGRELAVNEGMLLGIMIGTPPPCWVLTCHARRRHVRVLDKGLQEGWWEHW